MIVQAFKFKWKKVGMVVLAAAVLLGALIGGRVLVSRGVDGMKLTGIKSAGDRIKFMSSLGISVQPDPVDSAKVRIPEQFDLVYDNYNTLQQRNGFDLTKYKGKAVEKWTYMAKDYEGIKDETVYVTLLIYSGRVVGGDVCTARIDGFMLGLSGVE